MARLIVKRLVSMVFIIFALAAVMFLLQKLSRTSPVHAYSGSQRVPPGDCQGVQNPRLRPADRRPVPPLHLEPSPRELWRVASDEATGPHRFSDLPPGDPRADPLRSFPGGGAGCLHGYGVGGPLARFGALAARHGGGLLRSHVPARAARDPALLQQAPLAAPGHRRHQLHQRTDWTDAYAGPRLPDPRGLERWSGTRG